MSKAHKRLTGGNLKRLAIDFGQLQGEEPREMEQPDFRKFSGHNEICSIVAAIVQDDFERQCRSLCVHRPKALSNVIRAVIREES